jgi:hypothetical protein
LKKNVTSYVYHIQTLHFKITYHSVSFSVVWFTIPYEFENSDLICTNGILNKKGEIRQNLILDKLKYKSNWISECICLRKATSNDERVNLTHVWFFLFID